MPTKQNVTKKMAISVALPLEATRPMRVILDCNYETQIAPAYQVSAQSGNARLSLVIDRFGSAQFQVARCRILRVTWPKLYKILGD